jgi:hypothetical protein
MSNDLHALIARRKANTQIIRTFFRALEQGDIDTWIALWAEDGVYLNPFTSERFPQERISGRDQIASALQQMRDTLDALQISGLKVEQTIEPDVAYAACDATFTFADASQQVVSHMLHRFEISNKKVQGWTDYANPVTRDGSTASLLTLRTLRRGNGTERPESGQGPSPRDA